MRIYETISSHHQEDLEILDNIDYLVGICEKLNAWGAAEILRQQAVDLRAEMFGHEQPNQEEYCAIYRIQT